VAMSKSRGNVVGAEEMAEKYGADTGRIYTLFAAPPEKDLEWSEESIEGAWRFLNRVYRLIDKHAGRPKDTASGSVASPGEGKTAKSNGEPPGTQGYTEKEKELLRKAHQTLRRVTQDFEGRWHFNSAIAQIMELVNAIYAAEPLENGVRPEVRKEVLELVTLMLAPMTPHLAEELWEMLGHMDGLGAVSWPALNADLAKEEELEIPVQINGKVRGRVTMAAGASQDQVLEKAKADAAVAGYLQGKMVRKVIFVADKLLNIVVG